MRTTAPAVLLAGSVMALAFAGGLALAPRGPGTSTRALVAPVSCRPPARAIARLELLFGTTKPDGTPVSEAEWLAFLDTEVTPRFPEGLTVLTGLGQWRNSKGRITRETSRMLLIWHVPGPNTEADITAIRDSYIKRFVQESVMRVDGVGCVAF